MLARVRSLSRMELIVNCDGVPSRSPICLSPRNAILRGAFDLDIVDEPVGRVLDAETIVWRNGIIAAGGTVADASIILADDLIKAIKAETFNSKIIYLLPLLGGDLAAAQIPLRDLLGRGMAVNSNLVDADFSESTGLQGNGSNKKLTLALKASDIGADYGQGFVENNYAATGLGFASSAYSTGGNVIHGLRLDTGSQTFYHHPYGTPGVGNYYQMPRIVASGNGHYYAQRGAAYLDGANLGLAESSYTVPSDVGQGEDGWGVLGNRFFYYPGRCAGFYVTSGTLTDAEASAFHTLLQTYLITPTGR